MEPTMTGLTQAQIGSLSRLSQPTQELIHSMLNIVSISHFLFLILSLFVGCIEETNNIIDCVYANDCRESGSIIGASGVDGAM